MTEFAVATMRPLSDYEENIHRLEVLEKDHQLKPESVGQLCPMNQLKVLYFLYKIAMIELIFLC